MTNTQAIIIGASIIVATTLTPFAAPIRTENPRAKIEKSSPRDAWGNVSLVNKAQFVLLYRLAKLHYPSMTFEQYKDKCHDAWETAKGL